MKPLAIAHIPLQGKHLIEASAGTGKTYNIALLVLRLIIERGLSVQEVVVVTFTDAATAELKERITLFLQSALIAWSDQDAVVDEEIKKLVVQAKAPLHELELKERLLHLQKACLTIDEAAIYTIHGFCGLLLRQYAFETGSPFRTTLEPSLQELEEEVVYDFWREVVAPLPPSLVTSLLQKSFKPQTLHKVVQALKERPKLPIRAESGSLTELHTEEQRLRHEVQQHWEVFTAQWEKQQDSFTLSMDRFLTMPKALHAGRLKPELWNREALQPFAESPLGHRVAQLLKHPTPPSETSLLKLLTAEKLSTIASAKAKSLATEICEHPLFQSLNNFLAATEAMSGLAPRLVQVLERLMAEQFASRIDQKKSAKNTLGFNDLLLGVDATLTGAHRDHFISAVQRSYKVALVDEFQDTDALQFSLFNTLFGDTSLYMIGDPKQAIYRFRGGDMATYLQARASVPTEQCYTLTNNWRSQERVIAALNHLYTAPNPFGMATIAYHPVVAKKEIEPLTFGDTPVSPLVILQCEDISAIKRSRLTQQTIIEEITTLCGGSYKPRIHPSDIAILVTAHSMAQQFQRSLSNAGIPATISKGMSVFHTPEADFLIQLLTTMERSQEEGMIRGLLTHAVWGYSPQEIDHLPPQLWYEEVERLQNAYTRWLSQGILSAVEYYLHQSKLMGTFAHHERGERILTNLRHLMELLHHEELRVGKLPHRLIKQFYELKEYERQEHEQRLESDSDAVQIMTIHKAKGLEFPIVFVPHCGTHNQQEDRFYCESTTGETVLDLRPLSEEAKVQIKEENQQEAARRFYVAATRTQQRLYLFHDKSAKNHYAETLLTHLESHPSPFIEIKPILPYETPRGIARNSRPTEELHPRKKPAVVAPQWRVSSFSGLAKQLQEERHQRHEETVPATGIFAFPRGAWAGEVLHQVFEKIRFNDSADQHQKVVQRILARAGYGEYETVVCDLVATILKKKLAPGFALADLSPEKMIAELEFYFSATSLSLEKVRQTIDGCFPLVIPHLKAPLKGFLNGFIDLTFCHEGRYYILDWKSNHLGNSPTDYSRVAMEQSMYEHAYHLQHTIYTVALMRYLRLTIPDFSYEKHFGGVLYIFLRGVSNDPNSSSGIFFHRPEEHVIATLLTEIQQGEFL